ncbi:hypothetical protein N9Z38_00875 [Mariniblastus sp.]|nr:hypothetical protein [Mariniblastus sp.]MDB4368063.1 hypothetical protein [Mariniblastus sp.]
MIERTAGGKASVSADGGDVETCAKQIEGNRMKTDVHVILIAEASIGQPFKTCFATKTGFSVGSS